MDTIYYNLNARKVKVSGGADLITFVPVTTAVGAKGEVLDFERCRRRLETKQAWGAFEEAAEEPWAEQEACPVVEPHGRRERAANWLEIGASAAVILVCLAAAAAFLALL